MGRPKILPKIKSENKSWREIFSWRAVCSISNEVSPAKKSWKNFTSRSRYPPTLISQAKSKFAYLLFFNIIDEKKKKVKFIKFFGQSFAWPRGTKVEKWAIIKSNSIC